MEEVKFKAVELCYSVFGEISLGFFFIQDFNEFFKTFYEIMQSSKDYFQLKDIYIYLSWRIREVHIQNNK